MQHKRTLTLMSVLTAGLATGSIHASTFFTEDFSDNSASPNMALGAGFGSPTTDFTGDFTITSGANSRIYLGTNDTDYSTTDFVFEVDVTVPNTTSAWAIAFIGMGSSDAGTSTGQFGEPITGSEVVMALRNDSTIGNRIADYRDNAATASGSDSGFVTDTDPDIDGPVSSGTHGLRMTWNATTKQALFEIDIDNNGTYDNSFSIDGSDNGFNGSNSQLFIGGGNGLTFDNISIIPEPSSLAMLGLGGLLIARRRRN